MVRIRRIVTVSALAAMTLAGCDKIDLLEEVKYLHQQATVVAAPQFSVPEGTYENDLAVTMSCDTSGVSFRYTVDSSTPRADYGNEYAGSPITISRTVTIMAVAYRPSDQQTSPVSTVVYTMKAAAPTQAENPVGTPPRTHPAATIVQITLQSATSGASIHYTTDGSTPSASDGIAYSGAFPINTAQVIRAVAYRTGYETSDVSEESYSIGNAVNPTIFPNGGSFYNDQTATLSCATPGATIYYTTNGDTPTNGSTPYTAPFTISSSATVKAIAYHDTLFPSGVTSAVFAMKAATPSFSPGGGHYTATQNVTISSPTSGAAIYYTTDGSTPTTSSTVYSSSVAVHTTTTLKALATRSSWTNSDIGSASYIYPCAIPTFSPAAGTYNNDQSVTITSGTSGATMRYTTDGSTPSDTVGTVYSAAVSITSTTTLKAIAYKTGWDNSAVASGTYTLQAATPSVSPNGATATSAQSVTLSTTTSGASIRYTTDGSTPSASNGTLYSSAFTLAGCTTLRAIAYKSGYSNSTVRSAVFHIIVPIDDSGTSHPQSALGTYGSDIWVAHGDTSNIVNISRSANVGDTWGHISELAGYATRNVDLYLDSSGVLVLFNEWIINKIYCAIIGKSAYEVIAKTTTEGGVAITRGNSFFEAHYMAGDLWFGASPKGDVWSIKSIDTTGDVGQNPSISVSGTAIYISYYDVTNSGLKLAKSANSGTSWAVQTVAYLNDEGRYSEVFTADGTNVSIVYSDTTNGDLKLARSSNGGSSWTITTIESTGTVGAYVSGVTGASGTAFVSYSDTTNKCVKIAKTTDYGATWTVSRVTASAAGDPPQWTSIGLSGSVVCVSYYSPTTLALWFAKSLDGGATW